MEWEGKRVLVTGAGGFIGSHLVERLVRMGANVRAFVRYNSRGDQGFVEILPMQVKEKVEVFAADLRDRYAVEDALEGVDIVFHLASLIAVPYSYLHPEEVVHTNVLGTLNVMLAAKKKGTEKVIHTSTSEVYGTARYVPIDEEHPLQAQSPYSASKIGADMIATSFYTSYQLPVVILRPFNTYGPRQSARAVIPTIITQALTRDKIFIGSTKPVRDFMYVDDTIEGFIKVAEADGVFGEVINIGTGEGTSIGELVDKILKLLGKEGMDVVFDAQRLRPKKSEVECLIADTKKAERLLGWSAKVGLEEGLQRTIEWISKSLALYKPEIYNI